jgi:hypothetical protein
MPLQYVPSRFPPIDVMFTLYHQHFSPGTTDKTSQTSQAFDNLERDASLKTQRAVEEGKRDVREAVSTVKVLSFPSPVFQWCPVLKITVLCFRVTSHLASPVLLVQALDLIPRRSEGLKRAVYIKYLYHDRRINDWDHNATVSRYEREITSRGLEIRRENIMNRAQLSARVLLHEIFERGVV